MNRRRRVLVAGSLLLVIAIVAIVFFVRRDPGPAESAPEIPCPADPRSVSLELRTLLDPAIERCRKAPRDPEAFAALGRLYHGNAFPILASRAYEAAVAVGSLDAKVPYLLGLIRSENGASEDAAKAFRLSISRFGTYGLSHLHLGLALLEGARHDEAMESLRAAARLDARNAAVHVGLARAFKELGLRDKAEESLRAALALDPDHAAAHQLMGLVLRAGGQASEAEAHLLRARRIRASIVRDPWFRDVQALNVSVEGRIAQADFYIEAGKPMSAVKILTDALPGREERPDLLEKLAFAHLRSNDLRVAARYYAAAALHDPENAALHSSLASVLLDLGDLDGASRSAERALALDAGSDGAIVTRAVVKFRRGDAAGAAADLEPLLQRRPDLLVAQVTLGDAAVSLGRNEEAEKRYRSAVALKPDWEYARRRLGLLLKSLGRIDDAIRELEVARRLDPNVQETSVALKELRERKRP